MSRGCRADLLVVELAELAIIQEFLPKAMTRKVTGAIMARLLPQWTAVQKIWESDGSSEQRTCRERQRQDDAIR